MQATWQRSFTIYLMFSRMSYKKGEMPPHLSVLFPDVCIRCGYKEKHTCWNSSRNCFQITVLKRKAAPAASAAWALPQLAVKQLPGRPAASHTQALLCPLSLPRLLPHTHPTAITSSSALHCAPCYSRPWKMSQPHSSTGSIRWWNSLPIVFPGESLPLS